MSGAVAGQGRTGMESRVLLVGDEECVRETISKLLSSEGIPVLTACLVGAIRKSPAILDPAEAGN